jgi:hypothetical protein
MWWSNLSDDVIVDFLWVCMWLWAFCIVAYSFGRVDSPPHSSPQNWAIWVGYLPPIHSEYHPYQYLSSDLSLRAVSLRWWVSIGRVNIQQSADVGRLCTVHMPVLAKECCDWHKSPNLKYY